MDNQPIDFSGNIERFSGFADRYDKHRPAPPTILASILTQLVQTRFPKLVVDLGSGTGLSARYWADKAEQVIGVEPTLDMRKQAEAQTEAANVTYREGFSHQTGLSNSCAQIVTCSQSLHWMEPQSTFEEAARILVQGGVFAAFDMTGLPRPATGRRIRHSMIAMQQSPNSKRNFKLKSQLAGGQRMNIWRGYKTAAAFDIQKKSSLTTAIREMQND